MTHAQRRLLDAIYQRGTVGFTTDARDPDSIICARLLHAALVTCVKQNDARVWIITEAGTAALKAEWHHAE